MFPSLMLVAVAKWLVYEKCNHYVMEWNDPEYVIFSMFLLLYYDVN